MTNQLLALHNLQLVQSRKGWTRADTAKAIADARNGIRYEGRSQGTNEAAHAAAITKLNHRAS